MAIDRFFTGFEGGRRDPFNAFSGVSFVDDGNARTGEYHLEAWCAVATTNNGRCSAITPTAGIGINNSFAVGVTRVFFYIVEMPSADDVMIMGYGINGALGGTLRLKTTGKFAAASVNTVGTQSTAALVTGQWYRADLTCNIVDPSVAFPTFADMTTTVSVYTEAGALIETVTAFGSGVVASNSNFPAPSLGHHDGNNSTYHVKFDDWISIIQDNAVPVLPTQMRITRVDPTGQAPPIFLGVTQGQWDGDWRTVTDLPWDSAATNEQTSLAATLNCVTLFNHLTAAELNLSDIAALKIYVQEKSSINGNYDILINDDRYTLALTGAYPGNNPFVVLKWLGMTNTDFDNMVFGATTTGEGIQNISQMYMEVLHGGSSINRNFTGVDSWKNEMVHYTGNGTYQEIACPFRPQVVIIKKILGTGNQSGATRLICMGGTNSRRTDGTMDSLAIQRISSTGFLVGPSLHVNESGVSYVALCIQDGGFGQNCYFLKFGAYTSPLTAVDNRDITIQAAWQPSLVFVLGGASQVYRTSTEVGDSSIPLTAGATITDFIQSLSATGFQVGTALNAANNAMYYYFAIRNLTNLNTVFAFGSFVGAGATKTVTGVLFAPHFVIGKRIAAVDAQWADSSAQVAPSSTLWSNDTANNNGVTAFTADGFTFGSNLSNLNDTTKWLAFKASGSISSVGGLTVAAGPDQNINETNGSTPAVLAGAVADALYPCAVITSTWTKISGPGAVTFDDATNPTTTAHFTKSGVYVLRITGGNGVTTLTDDVQITIINAAPVANAGPDQIKLVGSVVALAGSATDDGLPNPPAALTYAWTKVSGPGTATFTDSTNPITFVVFSAPGRYVLMLAVSDSELTSTDTLTIDMIDACVLPSADPNVSC